MEKDKVIEIAEDAINKSNKDLLSAQVFLIDEFEKTKSIIIDLTRHMDSIEVLYNKVNEEIKNRNIK